MSATYMQRRFGHHRAVSFVGVPNVGGKNVESRAYVGNRKMGGMTS